MKILLWFIILIVFTLLAGATIPVIISAKSTLLFFLGVVLIPITVYINWLICLKIFSEIVLKFFNSKV